MDLQFILLRAVRRVRGLGYTPVPVCATGGELVEIVDLSSSRLNSQCDLMIARASDLRLADAVVGHLVLNCVD